MQANYQYFMRTNMSNYIGEWVAICDKKIVSHGKDVKEVFKEAKSKCSKGRPFLTKVPEKDTMIF